MSLRTAVRRVQAFWRTHLELTERHLLAHRPWEEEYLHWAWTGREWVLHGELLPPPRRGVSTTRGGWCRFAATPAVAPTATPTDGSRPLA